MRFMVFSIGYADFMTVRRRRRERANTGALGTRKKALLLL
jgi:hypothetical protein